MSREYCVAVVGATGMVGMSMREILEEREFPVSDLRLLASERSRGRRLPFRGEEVEVRVLDEDSFRGVDLALFSAGADIALRFAPLAAEAGALVVDNSSAFRMDEDVPLVVPEVNPEDAFRHRGIIANPNCSTIQMVVVLNPIHRRYGIRRVVVSTYQSVSGTGKKAIEELFDQTRALLNFLPVPRSVYPHRIAFNCLPQIDRFLDNGYTKEEMKMVNETRKILEDETIGVTATTVRVPVFYGHSEAVNVETRQSCPPQEVRELLSRSPGVLVVDEPSAGRYPMPIDAAGQDLTWVGRIRRDESVENGLNLWIVADNIRKGAATNAVQIAQLLARDHL